MSEVTEDEPSRTLATLRAVSSRQSGVLLFSGS